MNGVCSLVAVQIPLLCEFCLAALSCENLCSLSVSWVCSPPPCRAGRVPTITRSFELGAEIAELEAVAVGAVGSSQS